MLATLTTQDPIPPATTSQALVFAVPAADLNGHSPAITVDDLGDGNGQILECVEDNNTALGAPFTCDTKPG